MQVILTEYIFLLAMPQRKTQNLVKVDGQRYIISARMPFYVSKVQRIKGKKCREKPIKDR